MGNSSSSSSSSSNGSGNAASSGGVATGAGECPVKHDSSSSSSPGECPVKHAEAPAPASGSPGECPVKHGQGASKQQYNVYAQPIDPTNQMPLNPNQLPAPGQENELSTERVKSLIPKGGTDNETWQYPSPQMFYNALVRKGKGSDVDEKEVEVIVAVHNNMNERAWGLVSRWEQVLHAEEYKKGNGVRLSRFMGRPDDISPMAWVKSTFFGYPKPFDRHDWVVERDGGKEVRYVIDFYFDDEANKEDEIPSLHDAKSVRSITMDARPAVDSLESLVDRIKFPIMEKLDMVPKEELAHVGAQGETSPAAKQEASSESASKTAPAGPTDFKNITPSDLKDFSMGIGQKCSTCFEKMQTCESETECQRASVMLSHCMASVVCKPEADAYNSNLTSEGALENMTSCLARFEKAALALREAQNKEAK